MHWRGFSLVDKIKSTLFSKLSLISIVSRDSNIGQLAFSTFTILRKIVLAVLKRSACVCVCVCEREREREKESQ